MDTNFTGTSRRSQLRAAMSGLPVGVQCGTRGQLPATGRRPGGFGLVGSGLVPAAAMRRRTAA